MEVCKGVRIGLTHRVVVVPASIEVNVILPIVVVVVIVVIVVVVNMEGRRRFEKLPEL